MELTVSPVINKLNEIKSYVFYYKYEAIIDLSLCVDTNWGWLRLGLLFKMWWPWINCVFLVVHLELKTKNVMKHHQ